MEAGRCDSCGRDEDALWPVHRVYVVPDSWEGPGRVDVQDELERWCAACRLHYPHQEVDPG